MLLNNEGKKDFLQSKFHQYFDINLKPLTDIDENCIEQFVNLTISLEQLNALYDLDSMKKFFNSDYNNIIFTPQDSIDIYDYEFYKGIFYIRLKPFSTKIRMHIIPKKYDASNTLSSNPILIFKDSNQNIEESDSFIYTDPFNFGCTENYERHEEEENINLYYKTDEFLDEAGLYKFNIKEKTQGIHNLQINAGISYNDTDPNEEPLSDENETYHFLGIADESNEYGNKISSSDFTEFNESLLLRVNRRDIGTDEIIKTNGLKDFLETPSSVNFIKENFGEGLSIMNKYHEINNIYHIKMKYFNDSLYVEENKEYIMKDWGEDDG